MALDIPNMQRLAQPVTRMYEGRALRQRERLLSQEEELNQLKIDSIKNPAPDPEEQRKAAAARREALESFQTTAQEFARQQIAYEDSLKESGLAEEDIDTLLQNRWSQARTTLSETYGEKLGIQFDSDNRYSRADAQAWLDSSDEDAGGVTANLYNKGTGETVSVRRDSSEWDRLTSSGWIEVGKAQPTGTPEELGMTRSQRGELAQEESERNRIAQINIGEISLALAGIQGIESPTGFKGFLGEKLGGFVGQFSESAGNTITETLTGASKEDLATVRTRAKSLAARLLPSITGEESGRFTDTERALAQEVAGAIDLAQSKDQVASNLSELLGIEFRGVYRDARFSGGEPPFDLMNDKDMQELGEVLERAGMPEDKIVDNLIVLREIQNGERF